MRHTSFILAGIFCAAGLASAESLLLLPILGEMDNASDMKTVNRLYREVVEARYGGTVLPPDGGSGCAERNCALQAAQAARADEVIFSTLNHLGSKWVFSSTIMKADGRDAFYQRLTALSVEDMEAVTKRMTDALMTRKTIEEAATLDNLTQKEATKEPERRISLYKSGVGVGYIFPTDSSFKNRSLSSDGSYVPIIRLAWVNDWQFNNNLLLNTDLLWGMGAEVGGDVNLDYLLNRSDYSPFVGGGLGLHYVYADDIGRSSGFALNAQTGMMLFRTYDVNVMVRGYYQIIFNTALDNGVGLDVNVTYHNSNADKKQSSSGGGGGGFFTYVGYFFVGLIAISVIAAMNN